MSLKRRHQSRRTVLQAGLAAGFSLLPSIAKAAEIKPTNGYTIMDVLIAALQSIGGPVCLDAAHRLGTVGATNASFNLHLRSAELNADDARILATAMQALPGSPGHGLRSFSASYNPDLKDAGSMALAEAFPTTMTELGLVGCYIEDVGGRALLNWAQQAPSLRMICVEGNRFSSGLRSDFASLGRQRSLMVVV